MDAQEGVTEAWDSRVEVPVGSPQGYCTGLQANFSISVRLTCRPCHCAGSPCYLPEQRASQAVRGNARGNHLESV